MSVAKIKPGTRLLNNVGSFVFRDNRLNMVAFTGSFATTYSVEITMSANDTRGGAGNALIFRSYSDRNVNATLTVQDWNLAYVAACVGSQIEYGLSELFIIEKSLAITGGVATLNKTAIGSVSVRLPNGSRVEVSPGINNTIDLSAYNLTDGDCVFVTYAFNANAKSVTITADKSPYVGNLIMQGVISDSLIGQVGTVTVDIPSFALDGNMTITMNADGTTSTTELVGTALSVDGRVCGEGQVYGYVKEYIEDDVAPQLVGIVASPSPIELALTPSPETQMIAVVGSRGVMYSEVGILNADCTFTSSASTIATVNSSGLITAVSAGDCTITVAHTASGLTDEIEVEVV